MAKKQRNMRGPQMYNRPTKAFQQNMAKNMPEMEMPKMPQKKQMMILNVAVGVVAVGLMVVLSMFAHWAFALIPLILLFVYIVMFGRYMNSKQKELLSYYQKMGMTKKMFFKQVARQNLKERDVKTYNRMWDVVENRDNIKLTFMEKIMGY